MRSLFGLGWGYSVRKATVTRGCGLVNLGIHERINVVDFYSNPMQDQPRINEEEAPELENKVVFTYNTLTSKLIVRYYYQYVLVMSESGKNLVSEINHQLANSDENDVVMDQSTFMYEGVLYCTLPYQIGATTVTCVDLFQNGLGQQFQISVVQNLIELHNCLSNNDNYL